MSKKKKTSYFRRYKEGLWIPNLYLMYSYWYEFLKISMKEKRKVDWKYYRKWGGKKMFDVSFRTWWNKNWKELFGMKDIGDEVKYPMRENSYKEKGVRKYLITYKNKDKNKNDIFKILMDKGLVDKDNIRVGETVNRFKKNAEKILDNVCKGIFP